MVTKQQILDLVKEYVEEKRSHESWKEGDWVPYSGPVFDSSEYIAAIDSFLDEWLIFGPKGREFEVEFSKHLGKTDGVLVNSGSSANLLMVTAAKKIYKWEDGDKIITPVVCFPTTINPIIQNNLVPVFVDSTLPSLNLDLDQVEEKLKEDPGIKGIVFAHVLGNPPNMDRLMDLVEKYDLVLMEDSCDALGSTYRGQKLGSFGQFSTCSFFPAHHMTMGEGGFVAASVGKGRRLLASLRDWGRACFCNTSKPGNVMEGTACGDRFKTWLPGKPEAVYDHRYVFDEIGYNLKPLELQACMGLEQLKKLPFLDRKRRENHSRLHSIFEKHGKYFHLPEAEPGSDPCWFAFLLTVREDAPFSRQDIVSFLESKKIQTRSYFCGNILAHPAYYPMVEPGTKLEEVYPIADIVTTNSFFMGTYAGLTEDQIVYISKVTDSFFESLNIGARAG